MQAIQYTFNSMPNALNFCVYERLREAEMSVIRKTQIHKSLLLSVIRNLVEMHPSAYMEYEARGLSITRVS